MQPGGLFMLHQICCPCSQKITSLSAWWIVMQVIHTSIQQYSLYPHVEQTHTLSSKKKTPKICHTYFSSQHSSLMSHCNAVVTFKMLLKTFQFVLYAPFLWFRSLFFTFKLIFFSGSLPNQKLNCNDSEVKVSCIKVLQFHCVVRYYKNHRFSRIMFGFKRNRNLASFF